MTFIVPIIFNGNFNSIAPQLFELNTIAFLQQDGISFAEVGRIKGRDQCIQISILVLGAVAVAVVSSSVVPFLISAVTSTFGSTTTDSNSNVIPAALVGLGLVIAFWNQV